MSGGPDIAVLTPTLRRPESLARALRSVFVQPPGRLREIVVADNDPDASARAVVEALKTESPVPLIYVHAPRPGVATARNAGLAATEAPLIAFLDDDEEASPQWLAALVAGLEQTGADVVFGPIRGRTPDGTGWAAPYLDRFFGREGPAQTGLVDAPWGCGNSLMVRATALPGPTPFDVSADEAGGEDDILFSALKARGGRFGWAADAWVDEHAPPHRANLRYALTRAFAYGQGPSQTAAARRDWGGVLRWMLIGAAQAAVWGVAALGLTLTGSIRRADMADRAARGLGKLFWMPGLEPRFYGSALLKRVSRSGG